MSGQTLREQVWESLRSAILEGRLSAGQRLGEVDLAEQLGVSRGTVREALRRLQQSGLVVGEDRMGLRVTQQSAEEVVELYEVRGALEALAAVHIVQSPRCDELVDEIEAKLPAFEPGMTLNERLDIDLGFHEALCAASGNTVLLDMWRQLQDRMRVAVLADESDERPRLMDTDYHRPIIAALRSGDSERARHAIVEHMRNSGGVWQKRAQDPRDIVGIE
ncbi:GntR family transcriptional regulator [Actinomyces sp. B33]|uniref:GntR family transcriptional regulator n=1 Tax=Actinomyces sp. B33 TaxID=2942131 RepID=UPI002341C316|nr:GntR family transcriptional regulator [Actinomyces sp. B33]MDC4233340.1 GntR family transcriptional regulator [Actinomyces sp. B33]